MNDIYSSSINTNNNQLSRRVCLSYNGLGSIDVVVAFEILSFDSLGYMAGVYIYAVAGSSFEQLFSSLGLITSLLVGGLG